MESLSNRDKDDDREMIGQFCGQYQIIIVGSGNRELYYTSGRACLHGQMETVPTNFFTCLNNVGQKR